jgi:hypothetical protein
MAKPDWQVDPRSKLTNPDIAKAYRDKTLRLITLEFTRFTGYSFTTDPNRTVEDLRSDPILGRACARAQRVTIEPYPYHLEQNN